MQEWINALKIYKKTFNFFSIGEKMSSEKKIIPKKEEEKIQEIWEKACEAERNFQEEILEKACEAERNFQKAVDMATGFLPVRSEEDRKFMEK